MPRASATSCGLSTASESLTRKPFRKYQTKRVVLVVPSPEYPSPATAANMLAATTAALAPRWFPYFLHQTLPSRFSRMGLGVPAPGLLGAPRIDTTVLVEEDVFRCDCLLARPPVF